MRAHIKYSPKKMRLVASLVRGMSVGEAKRQLQFAEKSAKGARAAREVLEEAQDIAVKEHGVEFRWGCKEPITWLVLMKSSFASTFVSQLVCCCFFFF